MLLMLSRPVSRPPVGAIARAVNLSRRGWSPRALFAAGEQGVWYDPDDFSSMFQDSAGTTPVTAAGQPVGLILDKRLGLVRGEERLSNGAFSSDLTGWSVSAGGWTWSAGAARLDGNGAVQTLRQFSAFVVGKWYEVRFDVSSTGGAIGFENAASTIVASGSSGTVVARWLADRTELSFKRVSGTVVGTVDNVSVRELPGNHAAQSLSASRPVLRQNAVTGYHYLEFDGIDDFLVTNSIDFTVTDKVSVFAGVRKLSDAAIGMLVELSNNSSTLDGTFFLDAPASNGSNTVGFRSRGTVERTTTPSGLPAPTSLVMAGTGSISGDLARLRVNGAVAGENLGDQGTGNYGNYPLYIGRRGGSTLAFNGHLYGLIVRGALTADATTRTIEMLISRAIGVPLQ